MGNVMYMNGQSRAQEAIPELILISSTRKKSADTERRKYFTPQHVVAGGGKDQNRSPGLHSPRQERDLKEGEKESSNNPHQVVEDKDQYGSRHMTSEESERGFGGANGGRPRAHGPQACREYRWLFAGR